MGDHECERLTQRYPDWHVWRSTGGSWLATRSGTVLTDEQMRSGLYHTLMEPTAEELTTALEEQVRRA